MQAAFPADTTFFIAAERRRRIELVESIRPDHTGPNALCPLVYLRAFVGPDAALEPALRVVGFCQAFFEGTECLNREDRPEDLLLNDAVGL